MIDKEKLLKHIEEERHKINEKLRGMNILNSTESTRNYFIGSYHTLTELIVKINKGDI